MWITTTQVDLVALRNLDSTDRAAVFLPISQKKNELQNVDGNGRSIPGFESIESLNDVSLDAETHTVKRSWNTESAAQEFALFVNSINGPFVATVEEQI
jgi:hypothetical protein